MKAKVYIYKGVLVTLTREGEKVILAVRCEDQAGLIRFDRRHEKALREAFEQGRNE